MTNKDQIIFTNAMSNSIFIFEEGRQYISNPSQAPKGAVVKRGPKGGLYFEDGIAKGKKTEPKPQERSQKDEEEYRKSDEYLTKYMNAVLSNNTYSKYEIDYYMGKGKRKNPHSIPQDKWDKVLKDYTVVHHPNEFGNDWWTFEKKKEPSALKPKAQQDKKDEEQGEEATYKVNQFKISQENDIKKLKKELEATIAFQKKYDATDISGKIPYLQKKIKKLQDKEDEEMWGKPPSSPKGIKKPKAELEEPKPKAQQDKGNIGSEAKKQLFNLIHGLRIGRSDFSDIAKKLDDLGVPFKVQNYCAYHAKESPNKDAYQIIRDATQTEAPSEQKPKKWDEEKLHSYIFNQFDKGIKDEDIAKKVKKNTGMNYSDALDLVKNLGFHADEL